MSVLLLWQLVTLSKAVVCGGMYVEMHKSGCLRDNNTRSSRGCFDATRVTRRVCTCGFQSDVFSLPEAMVEKGICVIGLRREGERKEGVWYT